MNISGDPGANQEIDFSIVVNLPSNGGTSEKTRQLIVAHEGGTQAICLITQASTGASLIVSPITITLDWEGAAQTVTVTSNTSWEII